MTFNKIFTSLAASAVLALAAGSAQAATYQFTVTGDYSASFQLDSTQVIANDGSTSDGTTGVGFSLYDVDGFPDAFFGVADVTFYNLAIGGGIAVDDYYGGVTLLSTDGPQLYTGDEAGTITFKTGTFALTEYQGTGAYTLNVTNLSAAAVPEPASLAMLLAGIGLVGTMAKRRRNGAAAAL